MRLLRSVGSLEKNRRIRTEFVNYLAACSAGRARDSVIIRHSDRADLDLGTQLRNRGENRSSLCAVGHSIRSVLDITA